MSYILDALQKSADEAKPSAPTTQFPGAVGHAATPRGGLPLPWKLAIGAVLVANITLVYLWRTDRNSSPSIAQTNAINNPAFQQPTIAGNQSGSTRKITLPGIASPKDLPPPRANTTQGTSENNRIASGTGRTFKPTGRAITIAGEPNAGETETQSNGSGSNNTRATEQSFKPSTSGSRVIPQQAAALPPSARARSASPLSAMSDGAREALHALSFSFHIYGVESDLRSVGVNGQRITEGETVTTDNGEIFTIGEITDSGAIIEFQHDGENLSVEIPVMEDWKES